MQTMKKKLAQTKTVVVMGDSGGKTPKGKHIQAEVKNSVVVDSSKSITHETIARRAWSIWMSKGCLPGQDEANWCQAERELRREMRGD